MIFESVQDVLAVDNDYRQTQIYELKKLGLPCVIYGAGINAHCVADVLVNNEVGYVFAVDQEYITDITSPPTIYTPEQCDAKYDKYILICGTAPGFPMDVPPQFKNAVKLVYLMGENKLDKLDEHYINEHLSEFNLTLGFLADEKSKRCMLAFLRGKVAHNPYELIGLADKSHYFLDELFQLKPDSVYIDCGAYNGDTVLEFIKHYGENGNQIIAFEPDEENFSLLQKRTEFCKNITLIKKGCSDAKGELRFNGGNTSSSALNINGKVVIQVDKIDNYTDENIHIGLIKMDIEGAEMAALNGAKETLQRDKPVLAISAYHKPDDLITIPQYIKSIDANYNLYVRYTYSCVFTLSELVIYAIYDSF